MISSKATRHVPKPQIKRGTDNQPAALCPEPWTQVLRVMDINQLDTITPDVIEAARETLVIGT